MLTCRMMLNYLLTKNLARIVEELEESKKLADDTIAQMKPHTREYLYFDNIRNGLGATLNNFKRYQKIMEEE